MILRPHIKDLKIIGFYWGKLTIGLSLFMVFPIILSLLLGEIDPMFDFIISALFCLMMGLALHILCYTKNEPKWIHGMIIVSFSWLVAALSGAVPLFLSGHWNSFLDAFFEAMSGLSTTGLVLVNDLNHMSYGHNLWRHMLVFLGGQGIVVVVLSFFIQGIQGAFRLYVGEARDERVFPNIQRTARFIWAVSLVYLTLGTMMFGLTAVKEGLSWGDAFFNGLCVFMAAFDTGGFAPYDQNMAYYHSFALELVTVIFMIWGAINFRLHYILWSGQRKELWKNFEIRTFVFTNLFIFALIALSLSNMKVYDNFLVVFRKGFYHSISAHTGTGFQTIYPSEFLQEWGGLALFGIILAMGLGGCVCSTTGGIKALRIGVVAKAFYEEVKHYVSSENTIFVSKIHHIKDIILSDKQMRAACLITIAYITTYFLGGAIGMICGYPFTDSLFESTSATGNVGLSCGVTSPSMPTMLKLTYIVQMWAGRLEFISVFALIGFIVALIKGK